jgi:thiosulfate reductase cytochrome b subunit
LRDSLSKHIIERVLRCKCGILGEGVLWHLLADYLILGQYLPHLLLIVVVGLKWIGRILEAVSRQLQDLATAGMLVKERCEIIILVVDAPVLLVRGKCDT